MEICHVEVDKKLIIVDTNFLAIFFGRNKNTIRGWKNSKNMPTYKTDDKGINYFNLFEVNQWVKLNITEKYNKNQDKEIDIDDTKEFELDLPHGLQLADINLKDSVHLSILAAHPYGEMIRDTLAFVEDQEKKKTEIASKKHDLEVKRGKYLKIEELNSRMSEFIALVKDSDINARAKLPIEISDELFNINIISKENKDLVQTKINEMIDEIQEEKYKIIKTQFMKHIKDKTNKITVELLQDMIKELENSNEQQE